MEPSAPHPHPPARPQIPLPSDTRPTSEGATSIAEVIPLRSTDRSATSFASFYRNEYERFVRVAYLILDSREQAEEAVRDSFVRLHGRWSTVQDPRSYLRATVVNRCPRSPTGPVAAPGAGPGFAVGVVR